MCGLGLHFPARLHICVGALGRAHTAVVVNAIPRTLCAQTAEPTQREGGPNTAHTSEVGNLVLAQKQSGL